MKAGRLHGFTMLGEMNMTQGKGQGRVLHLLGLDTCNAGMQVQEI